MTTEHWNKVLSLPLLVSAALAMTIACHDELVTGPKGLRPSAPSFQVDDGSEECPPESTNCTPLSQDERNTLWWDIQLSIHWWDPACADVGLQMQDYTQTGDIRKYDLAIVNGRTTVGAWQKFPDGSTQISFHQLLFDPSRAGQRTTTAMHEGHHASAWGLDGEATAQHFSEGCVDY